MSESSIIARHFSRGSRHYHTEARVQRWMADRLAENLPRPEALPPGPLLDIGCGTGYLTSCLLDRYPGRELAAQDMAPGMIRKAMEMIPGDRVNWHCADAETVLPDGPFSLIVSNAAFQWMKHLPELLLALKKRLQNGGTLAFATFGPDTFLELKNAFNRAVNREGNHPLIYRELPYLSMEKWVELLEITFGDAPMVASRVMETEHYPSAFDFLRSVSRIGASVSQPSVTPPSVIRRLCEQYDQEHSGPDGTAVRYEVLFFRVGPVAIL